MIVRHDISEPESADAMGVLIDANLAQRSLGPLEAARILKYRMEHRDGKRAKNGEGELRDAIAKKIGMSGRNLDRYVQVLDAPPEIQAAVASGSLAVSLAIKVASLSTKRQAAVMAALTAGEDAGAIIKRYLSGGARYHWGVFNQQASPSLTWSLSAELSRMTTSYCCESQVLGLSHMAQLHCRNDKFELWLSAEPDDFLVDRRSSAALSFNPFVHDC